MEQKETSLLLYQILLETRKEMREGFQALSTKLDRELDEHDRRIRELEQAKSKLFGGVAAISGLASVAWEFVMHWLQGGKD